MWYAKYFLVPALISGVTALVFTSFVWSTAHFYEPATVIYPQGLPPVKLKASRVAVQPPAPGGDPVARMEAPPAPSPKPLSLQQRQRRYWPLVRRYSHKYKLDPALVMAVIQVESRFDHLAVSPKLAAGLMQIVPVTAEHLGLNDPLDPEANLEAGIRYLAELKKTFQNDLRLVLAAYNAGPTKVLEVGGVPAQKETRQYIRRVLKELPRFRTRFRAGLRG
ncbi:MAG: lytic transglycosylase domain-containing protein [Desulfarculaceae bacterium]